METLPIFILASVALIITPGPDMIYVISRGMLGGRTSGVISACGVTGGLLIHTLAVSLGLAVLLQTSAYAFWALKLAGGVYLIWMGYKMLRDKSALEFGGAANKRAGKCFCQGMLTNVLNPKIAIFFVAFLP